LRCSESSIDQAVKIIKNGGIVVFPTDTVYGIGCDPYNRKAVEKIYKIKKRDKKKSLPILAYSKVVDEIADLDKNSRKIIKNFWPGPLTLILNVKDEKLKNSLGLSKKIAVRVPSNKWTLKLLRKCNLLVGTSANFSGQKPFNNPKNCPKELEYDLFLDDGITNSVGESSIIEFRGDKLILHREGVLSLREIEEVL